MKKGFWVLLFVIASQLSANGQQSPAALEAVQRTLTMVEEVGRQSYPEIKLEKIRVKTFTGDSGFFKARFSFCRFLTLQRMRHLIFVNPDAFERKLPENAFRSIIAHELSHVSYYSRKNRLQLFGLVRLTNSSAEAGFERKADLEAISKGYGEGLKTYREWLYTQIPDSDKMKKFKIYFSPAEIELVLRAKLEKPDVFAGWRREPPKNIEMIKKDTGYE